VDRREVVKPTSGLNSGNVIQKSLKAVLNTIIIPSRLSTIELGKFGPGTKQAPVSRGPFLKVTAISPSEV